MFVARDKFGLKFFTGNNKPEFKDDYFSVWQGEGQWKYHAAGVYIEPTLFPELKIGDEPIEVEVIKKE